MYKLTWPQTRWTFCTITLLRLSFCVPYTRKLELNDATLVGVFASRYGVVLLCSCSLLFFLSVHDSCKSISYPNVVLTPLSHSFFKKLARLSSSRPSVVDRSTGWR